jgi:hypothetical protein
MRVSPITYRVIISAAIVAVAILTVRCDFPSDPPLKSAYVEPPAVEPTDSTGVLLPLRRGVEWVYAYEVPQRPLSPARTISPRPLEFDRLAYFYVPYIAFMTGPGGLEPAFPLLLRNDTLGLSFYQPIRMEDTSGISVRPKFMFTLPYPAHLGRVYRGRNPEFSVRATHRDTLITMLNHPVSLPCHRYEVWKGPRIITVLYVVPGLCILRIEDDERTFHTLSWHI